MALRRLAIGFGLLVPLLVVSFASSATTTVSATAALTGSGTSYRLVARNTGDEPILCFGLLLDGVQPVAASGPPGVLTRVGSFQGRGLVHMQGNTTTPAIPAGGTANVDFQTNVAIPPSAGGEIRYSSTCQPGSDQVGRATGPPAPPSPPPPPPKPRCQCKSLTITKAAISRFPFDLKIELTWNLACAPKGGARCEARIRVVPPKKRFAIKMLPRDGNLSCKGSCKARNEGESAIRMDFGQPSLKGETLRFKLRKFCKRGFAYVPAGSQTTTVAFDEEGGLDRVQSDLNANGVPDGDEKK
jgi:hypothetical protein